MNMALAISVLAVEIVFLIVCFPLKVSAVSHVSLNRQACFIGMGLKGAQFVNVCFKIEDSGIAFIVNGKQKRPKHKENADVISVVRKVFRKENIKILLSAVALINIDDAKNNAILCALLSSVNGCTAYSVGKEGTFEIDLQARVNTNVLQIVKMFIEGVVYARNQRTG